MKPETEMAVMKAHFEKSKKEAATCLRAMGAELPEGMDPCSWEGMMTMVADVFDHTKSGEKRSAAIGAFGKWIHYNEECATYAALEAAAKVVESEMGGDGAEPEKEDPAKAPADPQAGK
jgi:hypothetical protein